MSAFGQAISYEQACAELENLPPQTYVEIGPGVKLKRKADGVPVMRIHYSAIPERNPEVNPVWSAPLEDRERFPELTAMEWREQNERIKYTKAGWEREQEIVDEAGGGEKLFAATLATYGKMIIIDDPNWFPQPWWDVVGGFDHGKTNATTLIKAYIDELANIYLCGEFYQMRTETHANNIWENVPTLLRMPDLARMRWVRADPSIFYDSQAQPDGTFTNINAIYKKQGFTRLSPYPEGLSREDLSYEERLNDHWSNLGDPARGGRRPSLYIVCRNYKDQRQPGLHPYDCPNLLWEFKRMRRHELSATQLLSRNPTEKIVDKDNHAFDASKYLVMGLPKPTAIPAERIFEQQVEGLNMMSRAIAAERFLALGHAGAINAPPANRSMNLRNRARMIRR